ncbi:hypothetical protein niasHS_004350 [Heterodera schachtii]|uniref:DUF7027 domain-containing protein n=1 Tax=Heterodera schachtii TaxID=97005 RepID=A0ABD2K162_HETSC
MDFDPDHEKWKCCFCRIPTGLKILGLAECVLATAVLALGLQLIHVHSEGFYFCFDLSLCSISVLFGLSSLLMSVGVRFRREQLLYPTVMLRVLLIIFVTVFGVSIGVVRPLPPINNDDDDDDEEDENRIHLLNPKKQKIGGEKRIVNQRTLMGLKLQRRRSSVYLIGQIDPTLMSIKRPSQCSQMC